MAEYQRFVSYIYLYDKGIKVKNSGFAKIECKDNVLRIRMNLKGVFNNSYEKWTVYLLLEGKEEILGIYTGELKGKGTSADFQMICSAENLNQTTIGFSDVKGLAVVSSNNKKYATFWKDTNITIENFREYDEKNDKNLKQILSFRKEIQEDNSLEAMSFEEQQKQKNEKTIKEQVLRTENVNKKLSTKVVDKETNEQKKETIHDSDIEIEIKEAQRVPEWEEEEQAEPEININDNWEQLIKGYKSLNPFSDRDIECIRIELKDLRILPKSHWGLSSNSFVLHGFYNYQYLILGKNKERFIIGVPGIYSNKEKLIASLFGFNEFKPAQVSEYKTGRFGYWYKYL